MASCSHRLRSGSAPRKSVWNVKPPRARFYSSPGLTLQDEALGVLIDRMLIIQEARRLASCGNRR